MLLQDLQNQLILLLEDSPEEVIQELLLIHDSKSDSSDEISILSGKLKRLRKEKRLGSLNWSKVDEELTKITLALQEIIREIEEQQARNYWMTKAILQQILVICKNQPRVDDMKRLLPEHIYQNCTYKLVDSVSENDSYDQYHLVILDDEPFDKSDESINNLIHKLIPATKDTLYFLYFGTGQAPRDYPYRLYFTNSVFSFHARIDEMIRYLKIMRTPTPSIS